MAFVEELLGASGPRLGGLGLLVIQPSPFCNIDCDYCYLPDRRSTKRMPVSVLRQALEKVCASGLVGERLSIVWHAGEPLALPVSYFEEAFAAIEALRLPAERVEHSMQSNGMLVNDEWCSFIKRHNIRMGLSIDGPAFIHDAHRRTRAGRGTHAQVMRGAGALRRAGIDFHAIAVITEQSLDHPDEVFNFFVENGISRVGFNIDELEGANRSSTLSGADAERRVGDFFRRVFELQKRAGGAVRVREFDRAFQSIAQEGGDAAGRNDQVTPFAIVSVAHDGSLSTFSPELLGMPSRAYGDFSFGNVTRDGLADAARTEKFGRVLADIRAGVRLCSEGCDYFSLCGGGAPSNKYYENGTFASAETMYCRCTVKTPIDIVLADLEASLGVRAEASAGARAAGD
ncbi:MAG TPA: cyclophane-forming radical SAM/SPASM peptide maturase GrrM/OscB [Pyrinomonadaceae bacterium]|nr:cyclophane-forming radical SAM/SPASM peptide maturase GrrM/OscB [Pyrinomonadaceae bacterium]